MQPSRNRREEHFSVWNLALLKSSLNFPVLKIIIDQSLPYMAFLKGRFKNNVLIIVNKSVQYTASASRTSRVLLKIPKCLYYSTMHEKQVFCFFYKIETQKQMPLLVLKRSNYKSNGIILHFFKLSSYHCLIDETQSFFFFL